MKPINLRQARKRIKRAEQKTRADENAAKFGRTKAQKQSDEQQVTSLARFVDQHKTDE